MDLKTESQLRTELAQVWAMLEAERAYQKQFNKAQAAIDLKVPRSGIPELDAMIRESRRLDMATAAMQGFISGNLKTVHDAAKETKDETESAIQKLAYVFADAMLAASEKEQMK